MTAWIPRHWNKPMSAYLKSAGKSGRRAADGGDRSLSQTQEQRFAERRERDRREMAAIVGREFLP